MRRAALAAFIALALFSAQARTFHLDSARGDDALDGTSEATAWRSLAKANSADYQPGDRLLLKRGSRFQGGLSLNIRATETQPFEIGAYGEGPAPVIDAAGYLAGIHLRGSDHVNVRYLEITADGGKTRDRSPKDRRYGVFVEAGDEGTSHVSLEDLTIHGIFPEAGKEHEGHNSTTYAGTGISIEGREGAPGDGFVVRNCRITRTGFKAVNLKHVRNVQVLDNFMQDIGGPAIQPGNVDDLLVRGNTVDGSGSNKDPRMHMRGSGIWPWTCNRVLIERNRFMHARGKGDSCGVHIDFNCRDVVVQYNLSIDNEGGFVEILGNNYNCAYRYNISINDGSRVKGRNGAFQEGKILWTSGFVGRGKEKHGPYNSYIYNNTIYVKPGSRSCFSIAPTTEGLLVANNILHILGETKNVSGDQDQRVDRTATRIPRSLMSYNVFLTDSVLPDMLPLRDEHGIIGDPRFRKPGGLDAGDYVPGNAALVKDRGIPIPRLEGDEVGLRMGLAVREDILGNPIVGRPDIGAIELK